jgi:MFS family permease
VQFIDVLGVTVVVTALPRMLASLHASPSAGSLVSGGYAMFFGGLLMLGARLGDRFGHRRAITAGLAVSALGALLGAVAGSVVLLTAARCLQGAGAAASVPSALRLLTVLAPGRAAAAPGRGRLERVRRAGRGQRLRRGRRGHRPGQLAVGVLGLPAADRGAGGRHRQPCPAG